MFDTLLGSAWDSAFALVLATSASAPTILL